MCWGNRWNGTYIPIITPDTNAKDYYNRKGFYSMLMQAVVDSNYCFTDIYIGWPGSIHDARVFSNSAIFQQGQSGTLFPDQFVQP